MARTTTDRELVIYEGLKVNNYAKITKTNSEVRATLIVRAKRIGIIITASMTLGAFSILYFLLSQATSEDVKSLSIPVGIIISLLIYFPGRYLLWNIFGKETIIITTKSITSWYDYGFFQTNAETILFNQLGTEFTAEQGREDAMLGTFHFSDKNDITGLFEHIYSSTVLISIGDLSQLDILIAELFSEDAAYDEHFSGFSLN
jgi:hypothetical protein